jgi:hypothetical protein
MAAEKAAEGRPRGGGRIWGRRGSERGKERAGREGGARAGRDGGTGSARHLGKLAVSPQCGGTRFYAHRYQGRRRFLREKSFLWFLLSLFFNSFDTSAKR